MGVLTLRELSGMGFIPGIEAAMPVAGAAAGGATAGPSLIQGAMRVLAPWTAYTDIEQAKAQGKARKDELYAQQQLTYAQAQALQMRSQVAEQDYRRVVNARTNLEARLDEIHRSASEAARLVNSLKGLVQSRGLNQDYAVQAEQYQQVLVQVMGQASQATPTSTDPAELESGIASLSNALWAVGQIRSELEGLTARAQADADAVDAQRAAEAQAALEAQRQAVLRARAAEVAAVRARTASLNSQFAQQQAAARAWWDQQGAGW